MSGLVGAGVGGAGRARGRVRVAVSLVVAGLVGAVLATPAAVAASPTVPAMVSTFWVAPGDMKALVSWSPPLSDGGSPITGYHIDVTGPAPVALDVGVVTSVTIPFAVRGNYVFTVAAVNAVGTGSPYGGASEVAAAPAQPQDVVAIAGDRRAFLSFSEPDWGGGTPLSCTAASNPPSGQANVPYFGAIQIGGLTNGVSYTFAVSCASTVHGYQLSKYVLGSTAGVTAEAVAPGPPPPPSGVTAVGGTHQATVSWTRYVTSDITSYVITPYIGVSAQTPVTVPASQSSAVVPGLTNGTAYTFRVQSVNTAGAGAASPPSTVVTTNDVPGAPTGVSALGGVGRATLSWSAPAIDGGSPVAGYVITPYLGGVAQPAITTANVSTSPVTGLTHADYQFTVAATNGIGTGAPSSLSNTVTVTTAPSAPTGATATAGNQSATVTWNPPADDGGVAITSYTVTANPSGLSCAWSAGPMACTISGLVAGNDYSFAVTATNANGTSPASATTPVVSPWSGSSFHPLAPVRILDSRNGTGGWNGSLSSTSARELVVNGANGVPADATAVVVNLTVTGGTAASFVTAWPSGGAKPTVSTINFAAGATIANLATVKVGAGGAVSFATEVGSVDLVLDLVGYYEGGTGDRFKAIDPTRFLDSRTLTGNWPGQLPAGETRDLSVRAPGLLPATATAVVANVTVTNGTSGSFLRVWPSGLTKPNVSNVNFAAYETIPNLITIPIGPGGAISFANEVGSVDVIVDVVGYFDSQSGDRFHPTNPTRVLDDRDGTGGLTGAWGPGQTRTLGVAGTSTIPSTATVVLMNMTATNGTTGSFLTVSPPATSVPDTSNINFGAGETIANGVIGNLGGTTAVNITNKNGYVDIVGDVFGYYSPL